MTQNPSAAASTAASLASSSTPLFPTLPDIRATAERLAGKVLVTPVWRWQSGAVATRLQPATEVWLKLELFQTTGTFKLRGALNNVEAMSDGAKHRGIVAASAGNHAIAAAYAARVAGTSATVVMPKHASPLRIAACKDFGAKVVLLASIHEAFARAQALVAEEGRTMLHPFDGPLTTLGTATIGLELAQQVPQLDAVVVPVGGGGLISGIAAAVKQLNPACQVFGVEPFGADAMYRSFAAGAPVKLDAVDTIADSLGAPYALPYSFSVCQRFVDDIVRVSDDDLCRAMHDLFADMKLAVEPAAAAATAALFGPLKAKLDGKRVALIVCGSNIDAARHAELLARATASV
jgi:threonine dehydratase